MGLEDVVRNWRKQDRGCKLEGLDEERTPALSHLIWFDNVFLMAESDQTAQAMLDDVTKALWENLGMSWKPRSLELLRSTTRERGRTLTMKNKAFSEESALPCQWKMS